MTEPDNLWIGIGYVRQPDNDVAAEFIVDARRYPDDMSARAVIREAGKKLECLDMDGEFRFWGVRQDEPAPDLPAWDEYRRLLPGNATDNNEDSG